jgi:hypothetical protein
MVVWGMCKHDSFRQLTQQTLTALRTGAAGFTAATRSPEKIVNFGQLDQTLSTPFADI